MIDRSNMKYRVSDLGGIKMVRFGLGSNMSCGDIPILNSENLFDMLYGELGIDPSTIYRISIVFTCSDNSLKCITESVEFNPSYLFGEEFCSLFDEFYNFVKEQGEKIELIGLDSSVVDVIIYEDEGVIYEDECD